MRPKRFQRSTPYPFIDFLPSILRPLSTVNRKKARRKV
ncbi:MAG: hypothetical protein HSCHL_2247 [Hydrogenibacillus schlegelii]|uniref:Uncharacterized protein n=1 Tax=Hydrogenibacillus schlegelii TaxID=1484 RepID=A0A2T5GEP5_HYDSH|nr:MAG: hypothetical protein HSCHL_2247 [Hydrogenibacillus schlegelii]